MSYLLDHMPKDYRFGGNCGVLAVAVCAKVDFAKAWDACKMRPRSKGGTHHHQRIGALKALKVHFDDKLCLMAWGKEPQLRTVVERYTAPGVTYMVTLKGHVVTVRDGIVMDQSATKPIATHWCRNKRVRRLTRIMEA